jgi:hypothetical protein
LREVRAVTDAAVPDWTAVVGALIAVYAATLSTLQWIKYFRDERPRIRVTLGPGRMLNDPGNDEPKLLVSYVNVGKIAVTIPSYPALKIHTLKGYKLILTTAKSVLQNLQATQEPVAGLRYPRPRRVAGTKGAHPDVNR